MSEVEPQYICRNFCVADPDTGVCLTCGRPPQPVVWPGLDEMLAQGLVRPRKELTLNFSPIKNLCFTKPPELWNSFEEVVFQEFPALYGIKELILDGFADACVMSGSGSSFVALFSSSENAARCAGRLRSLGHACFGVHSGRPVRWGS